MRAFKLGLVTGVVYFAGTLYWITHVMAVYGGLSRPAAILVNALLIAYLALFPAVFAIVTRRLVLTHGVAGVLAAPIVWVGTEFGRTYVLTGFPWVLVGYSQVTVLPIAQLASVLGVYGVSALVCAVSASLAYATLDREGRRFLPVGATLGAVLGVAIWGSLRIERGDLLREGRAIRVGVVQGNVDQGQKWDPVRAAAIFDDYIRLTRQALGEGAEFVLWPESSTPFNLEEDRADAERLRAIAKQAHVPMLIGSDQVNRRVNPPRFYNAAFLLGADGLTAGVYQKMHLVPFGEYVPFKRLLFFAAPLVESVGDYAEGDSASLLPVGAHAVSTSICYEVVYPNLVRRFVRDGSELLTTITNDAWFGQTSAPYQHFAQASMRAIENGRYLARAANTGISGFVDPYGRVMAQSAIFQPAVLTEDVRLLHDDTLYTRYGDIVAMASAVITLALVLFGGRR